MKKKWSQKALAHLFLRSLMVLLILIFIFSMIKLAQAGEIVIYQTYEGTTLRNYEAPAIVIDEYGQGYQTIPGTTLKDYSKPGFIIESDPLFDTSYPTIERRTHERYRIYD